METRCDFCEAGTGFLNIIYKNFMIQREKNCTSCYVAGMADTLRKSDVTSRVDLQKKISWTVQSLVTKVINLFLNESEQKLAENGIGILLFWSWKQRHGFRIKDIKGNKKSTRIKEKRSKNKQGFPRSHKAYNFIAYISSPTHRLL
jgi:hypothetical protein